MTNFFTHKFRKKSPIEIIGIIIFGAIAITGLMILFGFVIMWLWNWLMPEIFGLTTLSFWQSVGLIALLKLLLGGFGGGRGGKKSSRKSGEDCKKGSKTDFSKWKHYDQFWKEEGNDSYQQYIERQSNLGQEGLEKPDSDSH